MIQEKAIYTIASDKKILKDFKLTYKYCNAFSVFVSFIFHLYNGIENDEEGIKAKTLLLRRALQDVEFFVLDGKNVFGF